MNDPTISPPTPPPPPPPKTRSALAIVAAVLAVELVLSLGLCGYTMGHSNFENLPASAGVELLGIVVGVVGLIVVGIAAIVRSARRPRTPGVRDSE